ncbi:MAG: hypothetical protein GXP49_17135 [Deltaproteobacteria bacterium]|nr:hypothetical protein [Deltaproteobacteria bacterium]
MEHMEHMELPGGITREGLKSAVKAMKGNDIIVLGDFVLDRYLYGRTSRISREAPVLIVEQEKEDYRLGGAANVALNLAMMGARVFAVSLLGTDRTANTLENLCKEQGIDTNGLIRVPGRKTPVKTRVMAGGVNTARQQMLRIDKGGGFDPEFMTHDAIQYLEDLSERADALVVSDYGLGSVNDSFLDFALGLARKQRVIGDSRYHVERFRHLTAVTPNEPEAGQATGMHFSNTSDAISAGLLLLNMLEVDHVLLKRGRLGMILCDKSKEPVVIGPFGKAGRVVDVTGAGDTVLAVFSLALAAGVSPIESALLSNIAGGLVVLKPGPAGITPAELESAVGEI